MPAGGRSKALRDTVSSAGRRFASVAAALILAACATGGNVPAGYYRVQPHDTLTRIARRYGTTVQELVRWNRLTNPHAIDVGQVLRVTRTGGEPATRGAAGRPHSSSARPAAGVARPAAPSRAMPDTAERPAARIALAWPATGEIVGRFDRTRNKGIDLAGALDTPVYAAAAGKVVYAGNRLRGYGNLLIIKHGDDFLTVYAHNRSLLVKEGASVRQRERIALMGNSDSQRVMLHFELRYRGRSVDPLDYLPPR